ncbi:GGDEF domain-containing protein [uncultured Massilia sp.]|uniref:GGDEF domain-containing protein n=1 Tax=uncultured Massilia sp. TaxID=169973 RepID=UPI0025F0AE61|nr:GGDEF domain-containing protein [uncultured Massilia sp.]
MPNDPSNATIARLRGEFSSATTEAGFLHQQSGTILRYLRRALLLCSLFYLMFGINDIVVLGAGAAGPLLTRLAVPAVAYLAWRYVRRAQDQVRAAYRASSLFTAFWIASYMLVIQHRPLDVLLHAMSMLIIVIVIQVFIPNRPLHALAIAAGGSAVFLLLSWHQHVESTRHLASMSLLILFANAFGALAGNRYARLWREQYRAQQVLTNLSVRDPLTGCYNRRHLNAALLDGEIARARRYRLSLSLIMCDLDGFKAVNDTHGHQAGDTLLRGFATLLQALTRDSVDTVVRYGGEEFLIILPETRLSGACELAERIRAACAAQRIDCCGHELAATASFGVASADFAADRAIAPQALIAAADELMYEAKRAGRNRVRARQFDAHAQAAVAAH